MRTLPIHVDGLTLEGHLHHPEGARLAVLLLHGIPGGGPPDKADPGYPGLAAIIAARGHAAMHFDFRGARAAPGDFSFHAWLADLNAAIDTTKAALPGLGIVLVGSSAGGAAAIVAGARRRDVAAVATFASPAHFGSLIEDAEGSVQRFRNAGLIRDPAFARDPEAWAGQFADPSPLDVVGRLSPRPLLLIHGEADPVVPFHHGLDLLAAAGPPVELARIPDGGHQLRRDRRAVAALLDWLAQLTH